MYLLKFRATSENRNWNIHPYLGVDFALSFSNWVLKEYELSLPGMTATSDSRGKK
jgi:hypothetical protein